MKVYIGPYKSWLGPYQLADKILFWKNKDRVFGEENPDADAIDKLGDKLSKIKWLNSFLTWLDSKKKRRIYVKVDSYDCWSAEHTLALVIHPVLLKVKECKHGSPLVDDEDVPEHLSSTVKPRTQEEIDRGHADENHHLRWDWVLDEMIWTFEQYLLEDWEDQYHSGDHDIKIIDGRLELGENDTFKIDYAGLNSHHERMNNGRRLFAKYYESLWT